MANDFSIFDRDPGTIRVRKSTKPGASFPNSLHLIAILGLRFQIDVYFFLTSVKSLP